MLEKEYEFYQKNKAEFLKKYLNKAIVILGENVIAVYDTVAEAIEKTSKEYDLGSFMVKEVKEKEEPIIFRSRVRYAK